ncbi:MAG: trypsin-like peptidase domain-containing protein [Candidatus Neomarinimicrobiota bacterium]
MKTLFSKYIMLVLGLGLATAPVSGQDSIASSRRTAITTAIEKVSPAIASIMVIQIKEYNRSPVFSDPIWQYFFPYDTYQQKVKSSGSGVVISPDGYVLTNHHVVEHALEIKVTLPGGKEYAAEVIGSDKVSDLALIKLEGKDFPYAKLADSDILIIGEWVVALGNPFGLFDISKQPTATVGIISALHVDFGQLQSGQLYQDMIQTDAAINVGNSGGPLVSSIGEVIGINTIIWTGSEYSQGSVGIGFAIPINRARRIAEELKNTGRVDRSFSTGLTIQTLEPRIAGYLDLPFTRGVIITQVDPASAAAEAGLKPGDVISTMNGYKIDKTDDIFRIFNDSGLRAGDKIELTIYRDGKNQKVSFRLRKA